MWTTTELYYARAALSEAQLDCHRCGSRTAHREQTHLLTQPNVLLLLVQPEAGGLTLPGHGRYELAAVVYHQGPGAESGHYCCVTRTGWALVAL